MFEEFLNKRVKMVIKDGDAIKALHGVFLGIDGGQFAKIELARSGVQAINLSNIEKMKLDEDQDEEEARD